MLPCSEKDQPHIYSICMHIYTYIHILNSFKEAMHCLVWIYSFIIICIYTYIYIYILHSTCAYCIFVLNATIRSLWVLKSPSCTAFSASFSLLFHAHTGDDSIQSIHDHAIRNWHGSSWSLPHRSRWPGPKGWPVVVFFLWLVNVVTGPACIYI